MDEGSWIRCSKVEIRNDDIVSELALDKPYDLAGSHPKDPHVQFLNCYARQCIQLWRPSQSIA